MQYHPHIKNKKALKIHRKKLKDFISFLRMSFQLISFERSLNILDTQGNNPTIRIITCICQMCPDVEYAFFYSRGPQRNKTLGEIAKEGGRILLPRVESY